jgi:hypothetical protein
MRALREVEPSTTFYLAADSDEAYRGVLSAFEPGVVRRLKPPSDHAVGCGNGSSTSGRRGISCQQLALADLLNLAATRQLILSHGSSWEEVLRLAEID